MNFEKILQPFKRSDGSEFEFRLIPDEIRGDVPRSDIFYAIADAGGLVYSTGSLRCSRKSVLTVLNTLHYLENPTQDHKVPHDTFCFSFIYEYLKALKENLPLPDAYIYMLTPSKYEPYDPYQILRGEKTWADLTPLKNPPSPSITTQQIVSNLRRLYNECSGRAAINTEGIRRIETEKPPQQQEANPSNSTLLDNLEVEQEHSRQNNLEALPERIEERTPQRKSRKSMSPNSPDTLSSQTPPNSSVKSIAMLARSGRLVTAKTRQNNEDSESDAIDNDNDSDNMISTPPSPLDLDDCDPDIPDEEEEEDSDEQLEDEGRDNELASGSDLENETSRTILKKATNNGVVRKGDSHTSPPTPTTGRNSSRANPIKLVPVAFAGPSNSGHKKTPRNKSDSDTNDGWISYDGSSDSSVHDLVQKSSSSKSGGRKVASKPRVRLDSDKSSPPRDQPPRSSRSRRPRRGVHFSLDEGQRILDIICDKKLFEYTRGIALWKKMEQSKHFKPNKRTYNSLKEHFIKVVLPKVLEGREYKISDNNLKRLKQNEKNRIGNLYAHVCPPNLKIE